VISDREEHGEATIGPNREEHGGFAGWRIVGGAREERQEG